MFQAWCLPGNLKLSMWELSAPWPCLEEFDRTLLLVIDYAWTRQRARRGVQQLDVCLWQQLCLHHLQNQRNPDWVNYMYLLSFTGQFWSTVLSLMSWCWLFQRLLQASLLDLWTSRNVTKTQLCPSIARKFCIFFLIAVNHDRRGRASSIICILFLKE